MGNYYLYRIGQFLAQRLPMRVSCCLVIFLCDIHYRFSKTDRQCVENNLKILLGTDQVPEAQVRAVFRNFGKCLLEFFGSPKRLDPVYIGSNVRLKNVEHLRKVLQKGKGGILVSAHLGNWEMGGAVLPALGFPLSVVALAHKDPRVNALFNTKREAFGAEVIQADMAVRRIKEHLGKNRLVTILADRDFGNRGLVMDFLGRKTMIPKGAAFFSIKAGVPIIPGFFTRGDDGCFEVNIYPAIEPPKVVEARITDDLLKEYIQQYLTIMEQEIKKNPSQWLLFREFWQL